MRCIQMMSGRNELFRLSNFEVASEFEKAIRSIFIGTDLEGSAAPMGSLLASILDNRELLTGTRSYAVRQLAMRNRLNEVIALCPAHLRDQLSNCLKTIFKVSFSQQETPINTNAIRDFRMSRTPVNVEQLIAFSKLFVRKSPDDEEKAKAEKILAPLIARGMIAG